MNLSKLNSKSVKSIGNLDKSATVSLESMNKIMGGGTYCCCCCNGQLEASHMA